MDCIKHLSVYCDNLFYQIEKTKVLLSVNTDETTRVKTIQEIPYESNYRFNKVERLGNILSSPIPLFVLFYKQNSKYFDRSAFARLGILRCTALVVASVVLPLILYVGCRIKHIGSLFNANCDSFVSFNRFFRLDREVTKYNKKINKLQIDPETGFAGNMRKSTEAQLEIYIKEKFKLSDSDFIKIDFTVSDDMVEANEWIKEFKVKWNSIVQTILEQKEVSTEQSLGLNQHIGITSSGCLLINEACINFQSIKERNEKINSFSRKIEFSVSIFNQGNQSMVPSEPAQASVVEAVPV